MYFRENNNGGNKRSYKSKQAHKSEHVKVIIVFHDVNSILYMVNNLQPKCFPYSQQPAFTKSEKVQKMKTPKQDRRKQKIKEWNYKAQRSEKNGKASS